MFQNLLAILGHLFVIGRIDLWFGADQFAAQALTAGVGHCFVQSYLITRAAREEAARRRRFEVKIEKTGVSVEFSVNFHLQGVEPGCSASRMQHAEINAPGIRRNIQRDLIARPGRSTLRGAVLHVVKSQSRRSRRAVNPPPQSGKAPRDFFRADEAAVLDVLARSGLDGKGGRADAKTRCCNGSALCFGHTLISLVYSVKVGWIILLYECSHDVHGYGGSLHIESSELDVPFAGLVELTHPEDEVKYLLRVPCPEVHPLQQFLWITFPVQHEVVEPVRLRHIGFDGKDGEPFLAGQEFDHPVLELKELTCAVRGFAQRDDPRIANSLLEALHVHEPMACFNGCKRNGMFVNPSHGRTIEGG